VFTDLQSMDRKRAETFITKVSHFEETAIQLRNLHVLGTEVKEISQSFSFLCCSLKNLKAHEVTY